MSYTQVKEIGRKADAIRLRSREITEQKTRTLQAAVLRRLTAKEQQA